MENHDINPTESRDPLGRVEETEGGSVPLQDDAVAELPEGDCPF